MKFFTAVFGLTGGILISISFFRLVSFINPRAADQTQSEKPSFISTEEALSVKDEPSDITLKKNNPSTSFSDIAGSRSKATPIPTQPAGGSPSPTPSPVQSAPSATSTPTPAPSPSPTPGTTNTPSPTQPEPSPTLPEPTPTDTTPAPTETPQQNGRGAENKPDKDKKDPLIEFPGLLSVNPVL